MWVWGDIYSVVYRHCLLEIQLLKYYFCVLLLVRIDWFWCPFSNSHSVQNSHVTTNSFRKMWKLMTYNLPKWKHCFWYLSIRLSWSFRLRVMPESKRYKRLFQNVIDVIRWIPYSTLMGMAWCSQATSHHPSQIQSMLIKISHVIWRHQGLLLLTRFNFNPSMDK